MEKQLETSLNTDQLKSKTDGTSSVISDCEEDPNIQPFITTREKLQKILHSHKFQIIIITLVVFDCLLVIAELILDVKNLSDGNKEQHTFLNEQERNEHEKHLTETAPHILHYMSIFILSLFIVEISVKVYAFRLEFFRRKLEVFDAFVVFLSFSLDVAFQNDDSWQSAIGLLIMLRLWRIVRILNGVVMSVKTQAEHKLHKERQQKEDIEQELMKCVEYAMDLEVEVELLRGLLEKNGIHEVPPSVVANSSEKLNVISVVAEMNHTQPA